MVWLNQLCTGNTTNSLNLSAWSLKSRLFSCEKWQEWSFLPILVSHLNFKKPKQGLKKKKTFFLKLILETPSTFNHFFTASGLFLCVIHIVVDFRSFSPKQMMSWAVVFCSVSHHCDRVWVIRSCSRIQTTLARGNFPRWFFTSEATMTTSPTVRGYWWWTVHFW